MPGKSLTHAATRPFKRKSRSPAVQTAEEELGFALPVTVIPWYRWEELLESGDVFARNVMRDHILLGGGPPVMKWDDCRRKGLIRKDSEAPSRVSARSFCEAAEEQLNRTV
jgi:hypothetical protein